VSSPLHVGGYLARGIHRANSKVSSVGDQNLYSNIH